MKDMPNEIQCECGYMGSPEIKRHFTKTDIIITVALFLIFTPAGIIFLAVKFFTAKSAFCPKCGKNVFEDNQTYSETGKNIGKTIMNVAKNPEVRKSFKNLGKSASDFHDSMYL